MRRFLPQLFLLLFLVACQPENIPPTPLPALQRVEQVASPAPTNAPIPIALVSSPTPTPTTIPMATAFVIAPTVTIAPPPTRTPTPEPLPTIASAAAVSWPHFPYSKIGYHVAPDGDARGLGEWMHDLDAAGIPFFLKSADAAGQLYEAQELARQSGVPHTLVYRRVGGEFELPDYSINPVLAAREHWDRHVEDWPPELSPDFVWMETINEPDQRRSEWLAVFALETARLAVRDNRRWAAFSWSPGEPEPTVWEGEAMLAFIEYAGQHPNNIAIAVHEYSLDANSIDADYPFLVGRFQWLYLIADRHGLPRPTVLITEWGWEYQNIAPTDDFMSQVEWASQLYGRFPQVKGAAIWYLGSGWGGIGTQTQRTILPLRDFQLGYRTADENDTVSIDIFADYYKDHPDEVPAP